MEIKNPGEDRLIKGFGFAILATVLWSGNFIAARALHQTISPVSLAFFRWLIATICIVPLAWSVVKKERRFILPHLKYLSITAITGVTLFNTFVYVAGKYTSAMNLALIGTTAAPVFVLLITGIFLRQKISVYQVAGALVCIVGILILIGKGSFTNLKNFHFTTGDFWIFTAALSFAIYTVLVRRKPKELSSMSFLFCVFVLGTLFLVPAFIIDLNYSKPLQFSRTILFTLLYLGIGASVIAFLLWNASIRIIGPARTALFGNLIPVFSAIEATLMLHEKFTRVTLVSLSVILIGILIANLNFFKKSQLPKA